MGAHCDDGQQGVYVKCVQSTTAALWRRACLLAEASADPAIAADDLMQEMRAALWAARGQLEKADMPTALAHCIGDNSMIKAVACSERGRGVHRNRLGRYF